MKYKSIHSQSVVELIKPGILLILQALVAGVLISMILALFIFSVNSVQAGMPAFNHPDEVGQGSLLFQDDKQKFISVDLLDTQVDIAVNGLISRTKVSQVFRNRSENNIEAIYVFPLPENASIEKFLLRVGDELIEGKIMEKEAADLVYEQAKNQGKKSAIMKQQRPNVFKTKVANIEKNSEVSITIEYQRQIDFSEKGYELRFPLVVGPRYTPKSYDEVLPDKILEEKINISYSSSIENKLSQTMDSIKPRTENKNLQIKIKNPVSINVHLNAGFEIQQINSPSHEIITDQKNTSWDYMINLKETQVSANKDFVLQWQLKKSDYPRAAVFTERDIMNPDTFYVNLMLMPPEQLFQNEQRLSKAMILVLDTSGSMGGTSIKQARQAVIKLLKNMHSGDSFNIIEFNSGYESLFSSAVEVNSQNIQIAIDYVSQLQANGGTEMMPPLNAALSAVTEKQLKQVIFITDGNVTNEARLFNLIHNKTDDSHLFTVGIGSAPNSYFMRKAAEIGHGSFTYIAHVDEVEKKMQSLFEQLDSPLLTQLNITWPDEFKQIEMYPNQLNDLYLGQALQVQAKVMVQSNLNNQSQKLLIEGQGGSTQWKSHLTIDHRLADLQSDNMQLDPVGIANLWARGKISALMDSYRQETVDNNIDELKQKVIDVSLKHQIISSFTSFVAISNKPVDIEKKPRSTINIPSLRPEGWTLNVYPSTATIGPFLAQIGWILLMISGLLFSLRQRLISYKRKLS